MIGIPGLRGGNTFVRPSSFVRIDLTKHRDVGPGVLSRLTNFLIAKSILEALLVGALAVAFYLTAFNPFFRGALDEATAQHVYGWAVDESSPAHRVEVQLYIDGRFAGTTIANLPRPDVRAAGRAEDELHGFSFETPMLASGEHEARVYAVYASADETRRTLHQIGFTRKFIVESGRRETAPGISKRVGETP
jgi:hypothetical protein